MAETIGRALEWNDEIENDGQPYVLLPEGDYDFTVEKFERGRHEGSSKIPPCNKAVLTLVIDGPDGQHASIGCNLFLYGTMEWKLCQFFTSIGARRHGERLRMDWGRVPGARGRCRVKVHDYTKKNGDPGQSNEIDSFLEPVEQKPAWKAGAF